MRSEEMLMEKLLERRDYIASWLEETTHAYNILLRQITEQAAMLAELEDQISALEALETKEI